MGEYVCPIVQNRGQDHRWRHTGCLQERPKKKKIMKSIKIQGLEFVLTFSWWDQNSTSSGERRLGSCLWMSKYTKLYLLRRYGQGDAYIWCSGEVDLVLPETRVSNGDIGKHLWIDHLGMFRAHRTGLRNLERFHVQSQANWNKRGRTSLYTMTWIFTPCWAFLWRRRSRRHSGKYAGGRRRYSSGVSHQSWSKIKLNDP